MIISFFLYPFYQTFTAIKDIIKGRGIDIDTDSMKDNFYVLNFFMTFGKYIIPIVSILVTTFIIYKTKDILSPPITFLSGLASFIVSHWMISTIVLVIQTLYFISSITRKVLREVEKLSKRTEDDFIKKIVH